MSQPHALEDKPPINWPTTLMFIVTPLAAAVLVPWYGIVHGFSAGSWGVFVFFLVACGMSVTAGYHRLWAHRTYEARTPLKILYLIFSSMALQNSALVWCSGHRIHHLHVDDNDRDPYSAGRGFWFSHIGWMLRYYPSGDPDFSNARDLERDPLLAFQHRHYLAIAIGVNVGLTIGAGFLVGDVWGTFILAGLLRIVVSHHFTFLINSLAHMWGTRPYTDENSARDNPVLAFLTHGEGYHNFHHIFAHDYRNGVRWWQWDPTKWLVASMQFLGLARRLKRTPAFQIQRALLAMQFQRAQEKLANSALAVRGRANVESLRERIAQEYESFLSAVSEWARVKETWYAEKKRSVIEHWEQASFQKQLREIEYALKQQRRRLRALYAQLA
ncbi:MAG TPA: fatty acid desaturase [Steroidobacteraceae bacterium]|jgi:stearoyl-CoA desaturase (Delta-9 desaturase)